MKDELKVAYAAILNTHDAMTFEYKDRIYRIAKKARSRKWWVEVLEIAPISLWSTDLEDVVCSDPWIDIGNGSYLGSAVGAIEFALALEVEPYVDPEAA